MSDAFKAISGAFSGMAQFQPGGLNGLNGLVNRSYSQQQAGLSNAQMQLRNAQQQWDANSIRNNPYLIINAMPVHSLGQQTCDAVNASIEVERLCFSLLDSGQDIRARVFNFGPWDRIPRPLTADEADRVEAEWEAEQVVKEVKSQYAHWDMIAQNEVDAIAPGWKE